MNGKPVDDDMMTEPVLVSDIEDRLRCRADDAAALIFFLIGAEAEGCRFQGRRAKDVSAAVRRLLNISDEAWHRAREAAAL